MALLAERVHPAVPGVAIAGFVALLGAQTLPWVHAKVASPVPDSVGPSGVDTLYLAQVGPWQATAYQLSWAVLLSLVTVGAMIGRPARRVVAAAALGWAAAQLAMLVGLVGEATRGGGLFAVPAAQRPSLTPAIGLYASFVALGLLTTAALLLARDRAPVAADDSIDDDDYSDDVPLDLTVTPLPLHDWAKEDL